MREESDTNLRTGLTKMYMRIISNSSYLSRTVVPSRTFSPLISALEAKKVVCQGTIWFSPSVSRRSWNGLDKLLGERWFTVIQWTEHVLYPIPPPPCVESLVSIPASRLNFEESSFRHSTSERLIGSCFVSWSEWVMNVNCLMVARGLVRRV